MAGPQLPEALKNWKIVSLSEQKDGKDIYNVVKENPDGTTQKAKLTRVTLKDSLYTEDNVKYVEEEADFINSVSKIDGVSNYISAFAADDPDEKELNMLILTDDSPSLAERGTDKMDDEDIVNFGLNMSDVLTKLEENNLFHGNIKPENIHVKSDGSYTLGGFTSLESDSDDLSYASPEIMNGGKPDYTTDIYSLGVMMYEMSNGGKLPFEDKNTTREEAIAKRMESPAISAPSGGSEKLKSVIVIACQSQNKNRWKNAGNIKNALTAIKAENDAAKPKVIAPENTDFDGSFSFDAVADPSPVNADYEETTPEPEPVAEPESSAEPETDSETKNEAEAQNADSGSEEIPDNVQSAGDAKNNSGSADDELDNRVFENYDAEHTKVFNIATAMTAGEKDYGSYFDDDDEPEQKPSQEDVEPADNSKARPVLDDYDAFSDDSLDNKDDEPKKKNKSKKGFIIAIIAGIAVILALLAAIAVYAIKNGLLGGGGTNIKTETTAPTESATTVPSSTAAPTTVQPTTAKPTENPNTVTVPSVIGYDYDYAEEVLRGAGFDVEISDYEYSDYYEEGLVMYQLPEGDNKTKKGDTVYVVVSAGSEEEEEEETTAPPRRENSGSESSNRESSNRDPEPVFSSYKNNTSYLTQAEVNKMSRKEMEIALNEIYARRGRIFKSKELADYFSKQSWYKPTYNEAEFAEKVVFNDYEQRNITLLYNTLYN